MGKLLLIPALVLFVLLSGCANNEASSTGLVTANFAAGDNLISNPGFESGITGWTKFGGSYGTREVVAGKGRLGTKGLVLYNEGGQYNVVYQNITGHTAGDKYELSGYIKPNLSSGYCQIDAYKYLGGTSAYDSLGAGISSSSTSWRQFFEIIEPPASVGSSFQIRLLNHPLSTGTCYFDDISLVRVASTGTPIVTDVPSPPSAPIGVTATALSDSEVRISWTKVTGMDYRVWRSTNNSTWAVAGTITRGAAATLTDSGLSPSTKYYYKAKSQNSEGVWSSYSNTVNATTTAASSAAPTNLTATVLSDTEITLVWTAVTGATHYRVWRKTSTGYFEVVRLSTSSTVWTDSTAVAGTSYVYKVQAYNTINNVGNYSRFSNLATVTTNSIASVPVPLAPTGVSALKSTENPKTAITFTWRAVTDATKYKIWRKIDGGSWNTLANRTITNGLTISWEDKFLLPNTKYYYKMKAGNAGGWSAYSSTVNATTDPLIEPEATQPPATPANVKAEIDPDSGRVVVSWGAISYATKYKVEYKKSSATTWIERIVIGNSSTSYTYPSYSIDPDTTYNFRVSAGNFAGYSNPSGIENVTTEATSESGTLTVTVRDGDSTSFSTTLSGVEVKLYKDESLRGSGVTNSLGRTTFTNLLAGTYNIQIMYENYVWHNGDVTILSSGQTSTETVLLKRVINPPIGLTAEAGRTRVTLSWTAPTTGFTPDKYIIEEAINITSYTKVAEVSQTSYTHRNLEPNTTYIYRIISKSGKGLSLPSPTASAKTENVQTVSESSGSYTLVWSGSQMIEASCDDIAGGTFESCDCSLDNPPNNLWFSGLSKVNNPSPNSCGCSFGSLFGCDNTGTSVCEEFTATATCVID